MVIINYYNRILLYKDIYLKISIYLMFESVEYTDWPTVDD